MKRVWFLFLIVLLFCVLFSCSCGRVEKPILSVVVRDEKVYRDGVVLCSCLVEEGKTGRVKVTPDLKEGSTDLLVYKKGEEANPLYQGRELEFPFALNLSEAGEYEAVVTYHQAVGELGLEWSL